MNQHEIDVIVGRAWKARALVHRPALAHLCRMAESAPDGTGVEIGVYAGSSLIAWGLARADRGEAIGVDNWSYTDNTPNLREKCVHNLEIAGVTARLVDADSAVAAMLIPGPLAFVFIDGNHTGPFVKQDIELWAPKLMRGGVIAFHDYGRHRADIQVKEVVDAWQKRDPWQTLGEVLTLIGFMKP